VPPYDELTTTIREAQWLDQDDLFSILGNAFGRQRMQQGHIETSGPQQFGEQEQAYDAWRKNPLAATIVNFFALYPLGTGAEWSIPGVDSISGSTPTGTEGWQAVADAIQDFWDYNQLDRAQFQHAEELSLNGEVFFRLFVDEDHHSKTGELNIRLVSLDPSTIVFVATHPEDVGRVLYYHQRYFAAVPPDFLLPPDGSYPTPDWVNQLDNYQNVENFEVAQEDGTIIVPEMWNQAQGMQTYDPKHGFYAWITRRIDASEVIHRKINALSWETRGKSDLYRVLNWLREYQSWLQSMVRLTKAASFYLIDVAVEGGGPAVQAAAKANSSPPLPGSIKFHPATELWKVLSPTINANDYSYVGVALKQMIAGGTRLALFMLGDGSDTSFAGGNMQFAPVVKAFQNRSQVLVELFSSIFSKIIEIHQTHDLIDDELPVLDHSGKPVGDKTINPARANLGVRLPEVNEVDFLEKATGVSTLKQAGLISTAAAQETMDLDPDEMRQEIADEGQRSLDTQIASTKAMQDAGVVPPATGPEQPEPPTPPGGKLPATNKVKQQGNQLPNPAKQGGGRSYPNHQKSTTPKQPIRGSN